MDLYERLAEAALASYPHLTAAERQRHAIQLVVVLESALEAYVNTHLDLGRPALRAHDPHHVL